MSDPGQEQTLPPAFEAKQARARGMPKDGRNLMEEAATAATNWRGTCCGCGASLSGTRAECLAHVCSDAEEKS